MPTSPSWQSFCSTNKNTDSSSHLSPPKSVLLFQLWRRQHLPREGFPQMVQLLWWCIAVHSSGCLGTSRRVFRYLSSFVTFTRMLLKTCLILFDGISVAAPKDELHQPWWINQIALLLFDWGCLQNDSFCCWQLFYFPLDCNELFWSYLRQGGNRIGVVQSFVVKSSCCQCREDCLFVHDYVLTSIFGTDAVVWNFSVRFLVCQCIQGLFFINSKAYASYYSRRCLDIAVDKITSTRFLYRRHWVDIAVDIW